MGETLVVGENVTVGTDEAETVCEGDPDSEGEPVLDVLSDDDAEPDASPVA